MERIIKSRLSEKRFIHTQNCVDMAKKLAERWGADSTSAALAALLHDMTKEEPYESQLKLLNEHDIILSTTQKLPKVIHAFSGALRARLEFSVSESIADAIRWHTTARSNMSMLEKVIWLADLTEQGRTFPGSADIRERAFQNIGEALVMGFDSTIRVLLERGQAIDINMIEARNFELAQLQN